MEKIHNTERSVPLFEFRDLISTYKVAAFEDYLSKVDKAIQDLHKTFAKAP